MRRQDRSGPVGHTRGGIETMRFGDDDAWIPRTWDAEVGSDELTELRKLERRCQSGLVRGKAGDAGRGSNRIKSERVEEPREDRPCLGVTSSRSHGSCSPHVERTMDCTRAASVGALHCIVV